MENILHESNEIVISLVKEYLTKITDTNGLADFTDDLNKNLMELGKQVTRFLIGKVEENIFNLPERKVLYESHEKSKRELITIFGQIEFDRRYYENKLTGRLEYLLDEYLKIEKNEKILPNVEERLIKEATDTTYEHAGEIAAYGTKISRQTTKNKIAKLSITETVIEKEQKKQQKILYILADEDHVSLQQGGIEMPRLVMVYESLQRCGKRVVLEEKTYFGGLYRNRINDLWEEVLDYLENNYDLDYVEKIYILGDGANWIKTGLGWIPKSKFVLDRFHFKQAVNGIVGTDDPEGYTVRIYRSLNNLDFNETKEIVYEILAEEMDEIKRARKLNILKYLFNNREGIINYVINKKELHGCSAEGQISHVYASRLSSRPKGWCITNLENMSKLRIIKYNKVDIKETIRSKNKIIELPMQEELREKIKSRIKKNVDFKPASMPIITFGGKEIKEHFRKLLEYKAI